MDFNACLRQSKSIVSVILVIVDADGTLAAMFEALEIFFEALNLFSEPRLQKRMDRINAAISNVAIWGFVLPSEILSIKENRLKYLLE